MHDTLLMCIMFVYYAYAAQFAPPNLLGYKLVGDNIDKGVKAKFMRVEKHCGQSLHYFHFCAIQNRIDFRKYSDVLPHTCLDSPKNRALYILPSDEDHNALSNNFASLVSRILFEISKTLLMKLLLGIFITSIVQKCRRNLL